VHAHSEDFPCANNIVTTTITIITTSLRRTCLRLMVQLHVMDVLAVFYKMVQVNQCITTITSRARRIIITTIMRLEASSKAL
jgi:hypothetical protein